MKTVILALLAASLAGCGNNPKASGNANYVGVGPAWTETEALPVAQAHCAQYGKSARYSASNGVRHMFDCI